MLNVVIARLNIHSAGVNVWETKGLRLISHPGSRLLGLVLQINVFIAVFMSNGRVSKGKP